MSKRGGKRCIAMGCSNTNEAGVSLFLFPKDEGLRKQWTEQVQTTRKDWSGPTDYSVLCSAHFQETCFEPGPLMRIKLGISTRCKLVLKKDSVPTIFSRPTTVTSPIHVDNASAGSPSQTSGHSSTPTRATRPVTDQERTPFGKPRGAFVKRERKRVSQTDPPKLVNRKVQANIRKKTKTKTQDIREEDLHPVQQVHTHMKEEEDGEGHHIKEEEEEADIADFPMSVIVKSEDDNEDCSTSNAGSVQPPLSGLNQTEASAEPKAEWPSVLTDGELALGGPLRPGLDFSYPKEFLEEMDLVADLLSKPFSSRTFQEKLDIVKQGRATPKLASLSQPGRGFVRHFQSTNYERYPWLTGSEESCKLYCWECLLFATDRHGVWSHTGFGNLTCLTKAATRHQSTAGHLQATVLSKTFGETRVDVQPSERARRERELHNEKVKKNREILKRLIDCVIFLGKQELSFRGHDERAGGNYAELLSLVAESNTDLHYHLSTNKVFSGTSDIIQNDLIAAIAEVMAQEIRREVNNAPFVSLMVDETTDASNAAAQLALVLRYVTDTGVKERFVRFEDVTSDNAGLIIRFLLENECLGKVVAQCFDGAAAVMSSGLNGVQAKVKERAPLALFIHCYAHRLSLVLTQGASTLQECKIFFAHLNGLAAFFSRSPRRTQLLDEICQRRLPRVAPTHWHDTSRVVNTVFEKRDALKELFDHILEHHGEYDEDSVRCADGLKARLDDFEFCFLLHTFNGIFESSDVRFSILQDKIPDVPFCLARVKEFCDTVERERSRYEEIYQAAERAASAPSAQRGPAQDPRVHYRQLHGRILGNIICQTQSRFQDHEKLIFVSLLDPQKFGEYQKHFPHAAFSSLAQSHGSLFDLPRLRTELTVMYAMDDFVGKSPTDLLDFLQQKNLNESMGQLYTFVCLAVTIPVSAASFEGTFSALKRIRTYARNTTGQARPSALASMAIEKDFLMELKRTDDLHNRVIEIFSRKEGRMDFVYK
ncbi:zinc finger MYM-type protein 1 isoform X1 [Syngnathus scovelli]|uniref:zinc finger MYM-type protein 1 isoform X1 n=1 Tax=Syngnathus scovelli TaxID=161590 RepID=UPI00210F70AC|nr:zinc finger MYM-type protein 1 isoform X1 [Syngnathus scovelli]